MRSRSAAVSSRWASSATRITSCSLTFILRFPVTRHLGFDDHEIYLLYGLAAGAIQGRQILRNETRELRSPGRVRHSHCELPLHEAYGARLFRHHSAAHQRPGQHRRLLPQFGNAVQRIKDNLFEVASGVAHDGSTLGTGKKPTKTPAQILASTGRRPIPWRVIPIPAERERELLRH